MTALRRAVDRPRPAPAVTSLQALGNSSTVRTSWYSGAHDVSPASPPVSTKRTTMSDAQRE